MKYCFFIYFSLLCLEIFAQNVSIELSLEWNKTLDFEFKELDTIKVKPAYLVIKYRNLTETPLYFSKTMESKHNIPFAGVVEFTNYVEQVTPYELFMSYNFYLKGRYNVFISDNWLMHENEELKDKEINNLPYINNLIHYVYNYIYDKYFSVGVYDYFKQLSVDSLYFSNVKINDKTVDIIKDYYKSSFLFLQGNDNYTERYNLIGFQLIGGDFTFQLENRQSTSIFNFLHIWNEEKKEFDKMLRNLPKEIDGYKLYEGEFLTNKVSVNFPGIRLRKDSE